MTLALLPAALLAAATPTGQDAPPPTGISADTRGPVASAQPVLTPDVSALIMDSVTAPPAQAAVAGPPEQPSATPETTPPVEGQEIAGQVAVDPAAASDDELVVEARRQVAGDPLESINAETFQVVSKVDEAVIEPVAMAYRDGLPHQIRDALSNFFSNLREPVVALNYLLQLKPGKAAETLARFAINSTIGVAGLIDVAEERPFNLPYRRNGFANTLGYYGVGQGPFLVVPLVGATTLRDMIGSGIDQLVMPMAVGRPFTHPAYGPIAFTVNSLDYRIENDDNIARYQDSSDPYSAMRDAYLSRRQAEIDALHGRIAPVAPANATSPAPAAPAATPVPDGPTNGASATIPAPVPPGE